MGVLNQSDLFELKICLENVKRLEAQIKTVDAKIAGLVNKEDVERHFILNDSAVDHIPSSLHLLRWNRKIHYTNGSRLMVYTESGCRYGEPLVSLRDVPFLAKTL